MFTSASTSDVAMWLGKRFAAVEVFDGFLADRAWEDIVVPSVMRPMAIWWD